MKGIFTSLSGALAQSDRLDTIANNIANVNTPGFKKDEQTFREYLTSFEKDDTHINVPRIPASIESFYDMQGGDKSFVDTAGTFTDFAQGGLKQTGRALDLALDGAGFLEVLTPEGVGYTRHGGLTLDAQGRLTTAQGFPVLQEGEGDPATRTITVTGGNLNVAADGHVEVDGAVVARLAVVDVANKDSLEKRGGAVFMSKAGQPLNLQPSEAQIQQGFLESSNVNLVQEMTNMITATRTFETNQKAIQAYDQMNDKLVNEVSRLG